MAAGCTDAPQQPKSRDTERLIIGFAEGDTAPDLGPGQLTRTLSLEGLMQVSEDGRAIKRLASEVAWENDKLLRVTLLPNVTFHNGVRLDAKVAASILTRVLQDEGNLNQYPALRDILSITADGDHDVLIRTSRVSTFLPEDLDVPLNLSTSTELKDAIGTGPYMIKVYNRKSESRLERFAQYHQGPPKIAEVVIQPFATMRTAWASLLRGEIDMVTNVPPDAVGFIANEQIRAYSFSRRYVLVLGFNTRHGPLRSARVRRALSLAVDRNAIVRDVLHQSSGVATGPFWPSHWAFDTSTRPLTFDPEAARRLLDEAGFPMRPEESPKSPPSRLRFECLVPEGYADLEDIALAVQKQLYDVGVDMTFNVQPVAEFFRRVQNRQFEAVVSDMISGPTLTRPYMFWRSSAQLKTELNVFGFENAASERLFRTLFTTADESEVRATVRELQQVFVDDPPAIFIAWQQRTRAVRRNFQVVYEPGRDPVQTLWQWNADSSRQVAGLK